MNPNLTYTDATPEDAPLLSATAFRSKKHWGYPDGLMLLWTPDLTVTAGYIQTIKRLRSLTGHCSSAFLRSGRGLTGMLVEIHS